MVLFARKILELGIRSKSSEKKDKEKDKKSRRIGSTLKQHHVLLNSKSVDQCLEKKVPRVDLRHGVSGQPPV